MFSPRCHGHMSGFHYSFRLHHHRSQMLPALLGSTYQQDGRADVPMMSTLTATPHWTACCNTTTRLIQPGGLVSLAANIDAANTTSVTVGDEDHALPEDVGAQA